MSGVACPGCNQLPCVICCDTGKIVGGDKAGEPCPHRCSLDTITGNAWTHHCVGSALPVELDLLSHCPRCLARRPLVQGSATVRTLVTPVKQPDPVCETCHDSHKMKRGDDGRVVPCTMCPTPCRNCAGGGGAGPYCARTPCSCACHRPAADPVRPDHYHRHTEHEVIPVISAWKLNFNRGNVIKYVARAALKGSELEDLRKAREYLDREIALVEAAK